MKMPLSRGASLPTANQFHEEEEEGSSHLLFLVTHYCATSSNRQSAVKTPHATTPARNSVIASSAS